jgi:hypothetical protein
MKGVFAWLWQNNNLVISMFSLFSIIFSYFLSLYLIIYILGMTIGYLPTEEITRYRKRPKKTSMNSTTAREVFDE